MAIYRSVRRIPMPVARSLRSMLPCNGQLAHLHGALLPATSRLKVPGPRPDGGCSRLASTSLPSTLSQFSEFEVPPELIAQFPAKPRDSARMIVLNRGSGTIEHRVVSELPEVLAAREENYAVVVNNSKVVDCKLEAEWSKDGRPQVLYLLERAAGSNDRSTARWMVSGDGIDASRSGEQLRLLNSELVGTLVTDASQLAAADGVMTFASPGNPERCDADQINETLAELARVPLPPYITETDGEGSYQTMFASESGSVAAPTAGLHFTDRLVAAAAAAGVGFEQVTLHVGYGTFGHVHHDDLSKHTMHAERFEMLPATAEHLSKHRRGGGKILAVGTTATRTLETCASRASANEFLKAGTGETDIFIRPGFQFQAVDALLTNLHMPGLTPLMLASAFGGHDLTMRAYREAIEQRYRFYSFGDCMLIL
eukprot:SAG31_NODE_877_length_11303_cov_18.744556_4_plen_427_part_00